MTKIAINGYGRIGRCVLRALFEAQQEGRFGYLQVLAINELADCNTIAHLTQYDSTYGRFPAAVAVENDQLHIDDQRIRVLHQPDITQLPWADMDIDLVLECTGAFNDRQTAEQHIAAGALHVLFSQPATAEVDATIVYGVNHQQLNGRESIVSNASCTTNCIVPVIHTLHEAFGIDSGVITTIHSAMNDQPVIDAYHHTDLRKTRSAIQSMIPVDTGLAKGIDRLLPQLAGRFEAQAMRVPTVNVSAMDLSVVMKSDVTTGDINRALREAAADDFNGVLGYTEELLASCDFNHDPRSSIVDATQTRVAGERMVKVLTWFDNEWGYANRMIDTAACWAKKSKFSFEDNTP